MEHEKEKIGEIVESKKSSPKQRNALGRGLDVLFGPEDGEGRTDSNPGSAQADSRISSENENWLKIPISSILPHPNQPRRRFNQENLHELAQSLTDQGILQPLLVRRSPDKDGSFQIIAGERRWRAAQMANLHEVPVIVRDINDEDILKISLIENIQRSDLTPVEEARALQALMKQFNHTQDSVSRVVGKSRPHVANSLRLLSLPESVLHTAEEQGLSAGHTRCLVGLAENQAIQLIKDIIKNDYSVRKTEQLSKKMRDGYRSPAANKDTSVEDNELRDIEDRLGHALGFRVKLKLNAQNKGNISFYFSNSDELNDLIKRLAGSVNP